MTTKPFRPMLATEADIETLRYPLYASAKLDGVRCIVQSGVVMSRTMKPIPNPHVQALFGREDLEGCDGELILGDPTDPACYRNTVGAVMRTHGTPDVRFYVFDVLAPGPFKQRTWALEDFRDANQIPGVEILRQHVIVNRDVLESFESELLAQGHEGLILRAPEAPYKQGRSTAREQGMLKLKRFADSEAEIVEVVERMRNDNPATKNALGRTERSSHKAGLTPMGTMGALRVVDIHTGVEFCIGTGFDHATAQDFWDRRETFVGQVVKYQHFPGGAKDLPRFPSFLGMRDRIDIGEAA